MKFHPILTAWIYLFAPVLAAQTLPPDASAPPAHMHNAANAAVIDGAAHPELIPDLTAYRLFFVSVADGADSKSAEMVSHKAHIGRLQFDDADNRAFISLMQTFRTQYDDLIQRHNQDAKAALEAGLTPDMNSFRKNRDALVQGIRDQLKVALSTDGSLVLDAFVSSEKRHMKIQPMPGTISQ